MGETGKAIENGPEGQVRRRFLRGGGVFGFFRRAFAGVGWPEGAGAPVLIGVVFRNGLRLGGIEAGGLVEVVG